MEKWGESLERQGGLRIPGVPRMVAPTVPRHRSRNPAESSRTRASCLPCVAISCKSLCSHGAQFLGQASKGQECEDTLPAGREQVSTRAAPKIWSFIIQSLVCGEAEKIEDVPP